MSEALSHARADGLTPPKPTLDAPDRFAAETEAWREEIITLTKAWCR